MNKPVLLILCGLPFAGKTTLAKVFEDYGFFRVTVDDINIELGIEFSLEKGITYENWGKAYAGYYQKIRNKLQNGMSVVSDGVAYLQKERDELRAIARVTHAKSYVIYIPTSVEIVKKRWMENKKTHERQDIREEDFEHIITHFQVPTEDEHVRINTNECDAKEWIEETIKNL